MARSEPMADARYPDMRARSRPDGNRRDDADDRHDDQQFDEVKPLASRIFFMVPITPDRGLVARPTPCGRWSVAQQ